MSKQPKAPPPPTMLSFEEEELDYMNLNAGLNHDGATEYEEQTWGAMNTLREEGSGGLTQAELNDITIMRPISWTAH